MENAEARGAPVTVPVLSVVIPSFNGRSLLETCLASIERHRPSDVALEVIVSDDGSTDGTADWLAANYPSVHIIHRERNRGFCIAANAGISAAHGTFIQLLNNDTEVTSGWVEAGLRPFADPRVGSVAPLVLVRAEPNRVDSAGDTYAFFGWPSKRGHGENAARWRARPPGPVFGASGSSAFYRASAIRSVGAFDPHFGSYYEDIDLAFRLRWAGYECVFEPTCEILHEISASYDHARPELQRRMARNAELLFWSSLPRGLLFAGIGPHVAFTIVQAAWRLARGRFRPFWSGKVEALRRVRDLSSRRRQRRNLARRAIAPPRFPVTVIPFSGVFNHLRRPREASARASSVRV